MIWKWVIIVLAILEAGWMAFDGVRALVVGDYVTPQTGPHTGQLGPWSIIVSAVGIEPRSTLMKTIFAGYGAAWLTFIGCFIYRLSWAWWAMLFAAACSLWYVPIGTLASLVQIILLHFPTVRMHS
jgi:hypothetical protein